MKLSNKLSLPQAIVDAVNNDGYSRGDSDISVTELISPPRQVALKSRHESELTEDASARIWSLLGQSIHTILERANKTAIAERRLSIQVEGWKISGGMDLYDENGVLTDYKTTSAWSCKGGAKEDWTSQLNIYAEILRANQHKVTGLKVIAILRDWSTLEAARDPEYPQAQVVVVPVPLWTPERAERFLRDRVILHQKARQTLPLCTGEERWAKPDTFAVMKPGGKRAVRVYESEDEALGHVRQDTSLFIVKRPGVNTRCDHYCTVSKFCRQYQLLRGAKEQVPAEAS